MTAAHLVPKYFKWKVSSRMSKELVHGIASSLEQKIIDYRHYLHENPELSFQEINTSALVRDKLQELGIPTRPGISGTSVLAELDSGVPGPVVLFRADMDALPIQEENDWPHRSRVAGVMHACGHDIHTSILLGLAEALSQNMSIIKRGKVLLAFQAGEEKIPGGALRMVEEGATKGVDMVFALHSGINDLGSIRICTGSASTAIGMYTVKVTGKGGHTGYPHKAIDPVAALLDISLAIQRIASTRIDPQNLATVSVSYIHSGNDKAPNIIPTEGAISGTIRCAFTEDRNQLFDEIENIAKYICAGRQCTYEFERNYGSPAIYNSPNEADIVKRAAVELGLKTIEGGIGLASEDFSYFTEKCPGAYFGLGLADPERPETRCFHHNPNFMPDERGMIFGLEMMLEICCQIFG